MGQPFNDSTALQAPIQRFNKFNVSQTSPTGEEK
jgi:hypothetical protein